MLKKIGKKNVLYPMPVTIVAALVNGKVNFINIAHVGILNAAPPHLISLGMSNHHYTNSGIKETGVFSVNILNMDQMEAVDYVGIVSGAKVDKSHVFETFYGELGNAPIIKNAALAMECKLYDTYAVKTHDLFIGEIVETYADESVLTSDGKVDLAKVRPLLFDMSSLKYWTLGEAVGDCWKAGKDFKTE